MAMLSKALLVLLTTHTVVAQMGEMDRFSRKARPMHKDGMSGVLCVCDYTFHFQIGNTLFIKIVYSAVYQLQCM